MCVYVYIYIYICMNAQFLDFAYLYVQITPKEAHHSPALSPLLLCYFGVLICYLFALGEGGID